MVILRLAPLASWIDPLADLLLDITAGAQYNLNGFSKPAGLFGVFNALGTVAFGEALSSHQTGCNAQHAFTATGAVPASG